MKENHNRFFIYVISIIAATLIFISCNNTEAKDADIKAEAEKALKAGPEGKNVAVEVKDGVVTLSGNCTNKDAKERSTQIVETIPHVKSVVNNCSVLHETEMTDDELNTRLYDLTKDISTVNSITIGAMDGVVQIAGPVKKREWAALKAGIDKLRPKGYDTVSLRVE